MISIAEAIQSYSAKLAPHRTARLDTELLIAHCLQVDRATLFREPEKIISEDTAGQIDALIALRKIGRPIAQLVGKCEFYSLEFVVTKAVLTPRADTEIIVAKAIELLGDRINRVADVGTGTGAIGVAVAYHCPRTTVFGMDISPDALHVAETNRHYHKLDNLHLIQGDWLASVAPSSLDLVISNPPYVESQDRRLDCTEIAHEPRIALAGGADGLDAIRRLFPQALSALKNEGYLLIEHGYDQGEKVSNLFSQYGFAGIATLRDIAGQDRACIGLKT